MTQQKKYAFPPVHSEQYGNGLTVLLAEDNEQDGLTIGFQMPVGEFCDPAGLEGITELTIGLLLKGPKSLSPEQFSDTFENVGASLFSEVGDEHCVIGCKMLSREADTILPLFWEMIRSPGFAKKELDRLKREMITGLQSETADPMSIANRHFSALLCSVNHPAGRVHTVQSVSKINLKHCVDFYDSFVAPDHGVVIVAGKFDTASMATLIKKHCESWDVKTKKTTVFGPALNSLPNTIVRIIDKPDLSQTSLILGHPIPGELDASRSMMALANYVLGGGNFSSRLMAHIRSKAGKTYGISSQISCNRDFGVLSIATSTQNSQVEEMLSSITKVYGDFAEKGITEEELQKAKQFAVGNMAFQLEGIVNVADKLLWLKQFDRDVSYIERFDEMINAMTLESVNDVIKTIFTPGIFAIVAVGKKEEITDILKKYGPVQTLGFRANPV